MTQDEISILIPSYNQPYLLKKTIQTALETNVKEIIISDDYSTEDTRYVIDSFKDKRLKVFYQTVNLGNWPNHLFLLHKATRPWIKFIQIDDELHGDWLMKMCDAVQKSTTVVSALPDYKNLDTQKVFSAYTLDHPIVWDPDAYLQRMLVVGNEIGRPSYALYRKDALDFSADAWRTDISADLIANVMCASKGAVALLPPGLVTCGLHAQQEGALQSFSLILKRHLNSILYLKKQCDPNIQRFADIYGFVGLIGIFRNFTGFMRRKKNPFYRTLVSDVYRLVKILNMERILRYKNVVKEAVIWKYSDRIKEINRQL